MLQTDLLDFHLTSEAMTGWQCETLNIATRSKKSFLAQLGLWLLPVGEDYCWWKKSGVHQLRLIVCLII